MNPNCLSAWQMNYSMYRIIFNCLNDCYNSYYEKLQLHSSWLTLWIALFHSDRSFIQRLWISNAWWRKTANDTHQMHALLMWFMVKGDGKNKLKCFGIWILDSCILQSNINDSQAFPFQEWSDCWGWIHRAVDSIFWKDYRFPPNHEPSQSITDAKASLLSSFKEADDITIAGSGPVGVDQLGLSTQTW
jgi:hypothetical protein